MAANLSSDSAYSTSGVAVGSPEPPLILIVEDNSDMTLLLEHLLRPKYRVAVAPNGNEGLEQAINLHPDLILCDLMMEGLSGGQLVRALRAHEELRDVPLVVLTALNDASLRAELLRAGAQDYLTKPFEPEELLARISHHLGVRHARETLRSVAVVASGESDLAELATEVVTRKRALENSLETLRQSRSLYHSLARNFAHASGLYFDEKLRFTSAQGAGFAALGHSDEACIGKNLTEVFEPAIASIIEPHFRAALDGVPTSFELPDATPDGGPCLMRVLPVNDEQGKLRGGLVVVQDLREHRLEEDEWQSFQASILSQVQDAVNVIDPQRRVLYWNSAAERLYGIAADEALGCLLDEIYDYEFLSEGGRDTVLVALRRHGWWQGECLHRLTRDGKEIHVEVSLSILREPSGALAGHLAVIRDITARKRSEEARARLEAERDNLLSRLQRENEETRRLQERLRVQFEKMPIGCVVWDKEFRAQSWNPAAAAIFGFTAEEMIGTHAFTSIVPPDAQPGVDDLWQRLLAGDTSANHINQNVTRDGRIISCQWSNTPLFNKDGSVSGVLSMVQDITDRIKAEETLRLSEERFRLTFEQAAVGVAHVSVEGRFLRVNSKICEILGYSRAELLSGMTFQALTYDEDLTKNKDLFSRAISGEIQSYSIEKRYVHKSGRIVWAALSASLVHDLDGDPYFISVIEDVTERKRAEQAQRLLSEAGAALAGSLDYETTLRTIAHLCVPALADYCVVDMLGDIVVIEEFEPQEPQARRAVVHHADPKKQPLLDVIANYTPDLSEESVVAKPLRAGQLLFVPQVTDELLQKAAQDEEHLAALRALKIRSVISAPLMARGEIIGLVSLGATTSCPPLTEQDLPLVEEIMRRAALALENARLYGQAETARRDAEAANRAKDEFLAVVSHELRTPLTPILGWVSMLRDTEMAGMLDEETRLHALSTIQQSAELQAQLVDDLLDVSRIISGNVRLRLQPLRLRSVVEAALDVARPSAAKKDIALWTSFDPTLGMVEGDARRLQQIIANLLSNAIKFTPPAGRIEIQLSEREGKARLVVRDSGIGIDPEFLPQIFERFSQADSSTSRTHGGLGLGLAIVRHLVELHGGIVEATSEGLEQGATFTVQLPVLQRKSAYASRIDTIPEMTPGWGSPPEKSHAAMLINANMLSGTRVLVVDDEPSTRDMLAQVLRHGGADVQTAHSASSARAVLARWKPSVLISDIGMPGEDGYSLISFVRALHPDDGGKLPAIALTAYARLEDREKALSAGYQLHLSKPVAPADLISAVAQLAPEHSQAPAT